MKIAMGFILLFWAFLMVMADITEGRPLEISPTSNSALTIKHCHPGDMAIIQIEPELADRIGGTMFTTNSILTLESLSMIPVGTNHLTIQTVCTGITSAPVAVTLILRREPPPPVVSAKRITMVIPEPPIPGSMKMPLPNAGNPDESYSNYVKRVETGTRRSQ